MSQTCVSDPVTTHTHGSVGLLQGSALYIAAVLGDSAGASAVPLLDLVAVVAGIVALGVLNAYLGAFAKLGASLGRTATCPPGSEREPNPGACPAAVCALVAGLLLLAGANLLVPGILAVAALAVGAVKGRRVDVGA